MIAQEFKIYDLLPTGPQYRASLHDQTTAIMGANALALATGRTHGVEIRDGGRLIGLLYFEPAMTDSLAAVHPDRMAEVIAADPAVRAAEGMATMMERVRAIATAEIRPSFISELKWQSGTADYSVYTTRSFAAAQEAVRTWKGARMRRNGEPHEEKGQSFLVVVPAATIEEEWQRIA